MLQYTTEQGKIDVSRKDRDRIKYAVLQCINVFTLLPCLLGWQVFFQGH